MRLPNKIPTPLTTRSSNVSVNFSAQFHSSHISSTETAEGHKEWIKPLRTVRLRAIWNSKTQFMFYLRYFRSTNVAQNQPTGYRRRKVDYPGIQAPREGSSYLGEYCLSPWSSFFVSRLARGRYPGDMPRICGKQHLLADFPPFWIWTDTGTLQAYADMPWNTVHSARDPINLGLYKFSNQFIS